MDVNNVNCCPFESSPATDGFSGVRAFAVVLRGPDAQVLDFKVGGVRRLKGSAVIGRTGRHDHEGTVQSMRKIMTRICPIRSNCLHSAPTQSTMSPHPSGICLSRDRAVKSRSRLQALPCLHIGVQKTQHVSQQKDHELPWGLGFRECTFVP